MARKVDPQEGGLRRLEAEFRVWREGRRRGERIPPALWAGAVAAAEVHGLWKTARRLRLDYAALKCRREAGSEAASVRPGPVALGPGFVEVPWSHDGGPECQLELEDARGTRLRVSLRGAGLEQLESAARLLWRLSR